MCDAPARWQSTVVHNHSLPPEHPMISDILADAIAEIDGYLADSVTPGPGTAYADPFLRVWILWVRGEMDALREHLDQPGALDEVGVPPDVPKGTVERLGRMVDEMARLATPLPGEPGVGDLFDALCSMRSWQRSGAAT